MKRIADYLQLVSNNLSSATYDSNRLRETIEKVVTANIGINNAVLNAGAAIDRLRVELERPK